MLIFSTEEVLLFLDQENLFFAKKFKFFLPRIFWKKTCLKACFKDKTSLKTWKKQKMFKNML